MEQFVLDAFSKTCCGDYPEEAPEALTLQRERAKYIVFPIEMLTLKRPSKTHNDDFS